MNFVRKLLSRSRVKKAMVRLSADASPLNYVNLAHEHAILGGVREALRICEEGLTMFPGNVDLARMADRIRQRQRERRMQDLKSVLKEAPRPAVWREMCEILLESAQLNRAEETCQVWLDATGHGEASYMLARIRVERFLADKCRSDGYRAFGALEDAQNALDSDPRPTQLRMKLAMRIGAWDEARRSAMRLLELQPGNPTLEARFRALENRSQNAPNLDTALRELERTGKLFDDEVEGARAEAAARDVRPMLKDLAGTTGARAAVYVRGGTALVHGPKGATAERSARAVREIVQSGRTTARRLGLGQVTQVTVMSRGGTLAVHAGELDAGALVCRSAPSVSQEKALMNLAGLDATLGIDEEKLR